MNPHASFLPVAVRAYTPAPRTKRKTQSWKPPEFVLVFDTETTIDRSQRLTFGCWRVLNHGVLIDEGLFYGDDLAAEKIEILRAYVRDDAKTSSRSNRLSLLSRRDFLKDVFWKLAYKNRALVVGFNLPFDLARIGVGWAKARGDHYGGGFSLILSDYWNGESWQENRYRPRVAVKTIDSKRALMGFKKRLSPDAEDLIPEGQTAGKPKSGYAFPGHLLDLKTLAFALTNQTYSLASACDAFGVAHPKATVEQHGVVTPEYIAYCRRDVLATSELLAKLLEEHARHPVALAPTKAFSPASVGKAYLRQMGITPLLDRLPDFPAAVLGYAMTAYYGGRAECRIRRTLVPVVYLDFLSMYPTVNGLMGVWSFVIAARIDVQDATESTRALLEAVTLDGCFDPAFWKLLPVLVQIEPMSDVLPVRAKYGGNDTWQIGVNVLAEGESVWYTLADCVASTLLTSKPPQVVRAVRFVPSAERLPNLQPVKLRGMTLIDPAADDLFLKAIELRKTLPDSLSKAELEWQSNFLKTLANATGYGIYGQMDRKDDGTDQKRRVTVHGLDDEPFFADVSSPEEPGEFCFPPFAAFIAGAARLMLALLERCVTDLGGTYAMCDTDSLAIVATEPGGLVECSGGPEKLRRKDALQALSWAQVEAVRARFAELNPYDRAAIPGSILKLEDVNFLRCGIGGENHEAECVCTKMRRQLYGFAISAKRYALSNLEEGVIDVRKYSEHGLGHLLNPSDPDSDDRRWMRVVWERLVAHALDVPSADPDWLDRPALSRLTISGPDLLTPFAMINKGLLYAEQVKPYNFLLAAHVAKLGHPDGVNPKAFQLIAPYERDSRLWERLPWVDKATGTPYAVRTGGAIGGVGIAQIKTYRQVLAEFAVHLEAKAAGPDGRPCRKLTVGLLQRLAVAPTFVVHVGKESNKLTEVESGVEHDPDEVWTKYADPKRDPWVTTVLPSLRRMRLADLAEATGLSGRAIQAIRNGRARPRAATRRALLDEVARANRLG